MPRANNPQVGTCDCPMCGLEGAKVHRQKKSTRRKLLYVFCDDCGCLQPNGAKGQLLIKKTLVLLEPENEPELQAEINELHMPEPDLEPEPEPAPEPEPEPDPEPVDEPEPEPEPEPKPEPVRTEKKRGFLGSLAAAMAEDD